MDKKQVKAIAGTEAKKWLKVTKGVCTRWLKAV